MNKTSNLNHKHTMYHFYQNIREESYFSFEDIYRRMVQKYPSGSVFVEVGVLHGMSLAFLGTEIVNSGKDIELIGVDNFKWHDGQYDIVVKNLAPLAGHVELRKGDSAEVAKTFKDKSVDFVFIDSDHTYESGIKEIRAWLPKIKPGGVLAGHDYDRNSFPGLCDAVDESFGDKVKFSHYTVWEVQL